VDGERCTKFFLNLEGKKQRKNYITELIKEEGEKITSHVEIMDLKDYLKIVFYIRM